MRAALFASDAARWTDAWNRAVSTPKEVLEQPSESLREQIPTFRSAHALNAVVVGVITMDLLFPHLFNEQGPTIAAIGAGNDGFVLCGGKGLFRPGSDHMDTESGVPPGYYDAYWETLFKFIEGQDWYSPQSKVGFLLDLIFPFEGSYVEDSFPAMARKIVEFESKV